MYFAYNVPRDIREEILASPAPENYAIHIDLGLQEQSMNIIRGDFSRLSVPFSIFEPTANGIAPDFTDIEIIDHGQTIRLGEYEACFDAVLEDCGRL